MRDTVEPLVNEDGWEEHPAFGNITVHRGHGSPRTLFDSEIKHTNTITVRISGTQRKRQLNRDQLHAYSRSFVEVEMSEAQWAAFVSGVNSGAGTSCTIRVREQQLTPELPYAPRMAESMAEVHGAGERALDHIREAFAAVEEKPTKANIRHLKAMIDNAPGNMTFAARSLTEHVETTVQRAKVDLEAMVLAKAEQVGLDAAETRALMPGDWTADEARPRLEVDTLGPTEDGAS